MPIQPYTRGCKRLAISIASDPAALAEVTKECRGRIYAAASQGARLQKFNTWSEVAVAAGFPDTLALDADALYHVAAVLWLYAYWLLTEVDVTVALTEDNFLLCLTRQSILGSC